MIKAVIPNILLAEWFTKSLLPPMARDVAMGGAITEEQVIARAQYLDWSIPNPKLYMIFYEMHLAL